MQKYYITDGNRYIRKSKNRYITTASPALADVYPLKAGQNILTNSLPKDWQKTFYLEGEKDFSVISSDDITENTTAVTEQNGFSFDESLFDKVENCVQSIVKTELYSKVELIGMKNDLENAQQFYDRAISDFNHWIENNSPAAHIRTKVYGLQHDLAVKRRKVKQDLSYVVGLIEAGEKNYTYEQLKKSLKEREFKDYTPNTYIYSQLDNLVMK